MVVSSGLKTDSSTKDLEADLRASVDGEVRFDSISKQMYSTDASIYQMEPIGVVIPRDAGDVQAVLEIAGKNGVSVLRWRDRAFRADGESLGGN